MIFLFSLIPATALVVVGYFVLYASTRAEGGLERFGKYLGIWIFFLAGVSVLGGLLASTVGIRGAMGDMMRGIGQHMERMENLEEEQLSILRKLQRD
jgi:hypothetical protein